MPAWRFEERYLLRMVEGMAYSLQMLAAIRGNSIAKASFSRQARQYAAGWKLGSRNRRFWNAQLRGQRRAAKIIAQHPELRFPRNMRQLADDAARRLDMSESSTC